MAFSMPNPGPRLVQISPTHTGSFGTELAQGYNRLLQDAGPVRTMNNYLSEGNNIRTLFSIVDQVSEQGADWDDEEGQAVSSETAAHAKGLLLALAQRAERGGWIWADPAISATPTGGIHLSWLVDGNRVALTVLAPNQPTVCVSKLKGGSSRREMLSDLDAVDRILQAFPASTPSFLPRTAVIG